MRSDARRRPSGERRRLEGPASERRPILFGTSGWRGALGEEVSFPRLRVLVRSIADWIRERDDGRRVAVGWDTRFASRAMAEMSAEVLAEAGLECLLSGTSTPTPAITHALAQGDFAAGIVLTASHNPALDHGLKVFGPRGSTIPDDEAHRIESIALARLRDDGPTGSRRLVPCEDFIGPYREALGRLLDRDAISESGLVVVYDAMHGTGADVLDRVLESAGAEVVRLRCESDSTFGGGAPDPVPARLVELSQAARAIDGLAIGLATDGDGDRFAVATESGRLLSETQVVALLVDHLARAGHIGRGVAITVGTGSLVEKVAASHGLSVERHPVGFKHVSAAIEAGRCDVAGEESGGFAWAPMGNDKDGLLAGCLLANWVATSRQGLDAHLLELETRFGVSACGRSALHRTPSIDEAFDRLRAAPPRRIGASAVDRVDADPLLRFGFADGGFLILRRSGTESKMRIYAEAPSQSELEDRLEAGARLLDGPS